MFTKNDIMKLGDYGFQMVASMGAIYYICGSYTIEELEEDNKIGIYHGDLEEAFVDTLDEALEIIAQWEEEWDD